MGCRKGNRAGRGGRGAASQSGNQPQPFAPKTDCRVFTGLQSLVHTSMHAVWTSTSAALRLRRRMTPIDRKRHSRHLPALQEAVDCDEKLRRHARAAVTRPLFQDQSLRSGSIAAVIPRCSSPFRPLIQRAGNQNSLMSVQSQDALSII